MKHIYTILFVMLFMHCIVIAQESAEPNDEQLGGHILQANPGPSNNNGSPNWAIFLNLIAGPYEVTITHMTTASQSAAGVSFSVEFLTRPGTALGGPVSTGPGSSPSGWTSLGTVPVTQGATNNGISLLFATPSIVINPGDTMGVAIRFNTVGPRYFGTGTPPLGTYADSNLTLITGEVRSVPFTTGGSFFSSRELVGEIHYNTVIPVELVSFTASILPKSEGNAVELRWITATELNNAGFYVERKTQNTNWDNISFVNGYGTTTETKFYSFVDRNLNYGSYTYRLKQIDFDGSFKYYELAETIEISSPNTFELSQNYPNPFNPSTKISFSVPTSEFVILKVYDVLGNEVATLVNDEKPGGSYEIDFDGTNLSSGMYLYTLQAGSYTQTKKLMLMK